MLEKLFKKAGSGSTTADQLLDLVLEVGEVCGTVLFNVTSQHIYTVGVRDLGRPVLFYFFFFWLDPLCASPCRAVMQHLGGSWDKRHAMRFYVLHVALGLRSASYVRGTYEDYEHAPDT